MSREDGLGHRSSIYHLLLMMLGDQKKKMKEECEKLKIVKYDPTHSVFIQAKPQDTPVYHDPLGRNGQRGSWRRIGNFEDRSIDFRRDLSMDIRRDPRPPRTNLIGLARKPEHMFFQFLTIMIRSLITLLENNCDAQWQDKKKIPYPILDDLDDEEAEKPWKKNMHEKKTYKLSKVYDEVLSAISLLRKQMKNTNCLLYTSPSPRD